MGDTIRVLTFNVFKFGGSVDADRVVDRILELEPDVIGFQEVYNTNFPLTRPRNARRILRRRLEPDYELEWVFGGNPGPFRAVTFGRFRDGIMVAAKRDRWDFDGGREHFAEVLGESTFDRRVIQCLLLHERGSDRTIAFFNTHLVVGTTDRRRERRAREIRRAVEFIARIEDEHRPLASIFVGDFNAAPTELKPPLLDAGRFIDTWGHLNRDPDQQALGNTIDPQNSIVRLRPRASEREGMRIDYVFARQNPSVEVAVPTLEPRASRVVLNMLDDDTQANLSDHYGVLSELEER